MRLRYTLAFLTFWLCSKAIAQPAETAEQAGLLRQPEATAEAFTPNVRPELRIAPRASEISIDGELDEETWKHAHKATNFTETQPAEGARPLSVTEAMLAYDEDHLYVAMIAYDDPAEIRARLTTRDNIFSDDMMGIIIDPFGDAVRAYEMYSNPHGIQADVLWTDDGDDISYDILFESEAKITSQGWQIEMRIPFKSLRFPTSDVQSWRLTFWRNHPRDASRSYSWASMKRDEPCTFCRFGYLHGLKGIRSGNQLELLPAFVTSQSSGRFDGDISNAMRRGPIKGEIGFSARYAVTQATSLETTINPDFSQIESDATQIDLNTTTALFYPERRPFFREGADLFNMRINTVYTRSINDPLAAFKTLTRSGQTNVAFLGAYDENSPLLVPLEERTDLFQLGRSYSGILRATHDFDGMNSIGAIGTLRHFGTDGYNAVAGLDSKVLLYESLVLSGQGLLSFTDGLENKLYGEAIPRGAQSNHEPGYAAALVLGRYTRTFSGHIDLSSFSPEFRSANGFVTRTNQRMASSWLEYQYHFDGHPWLTRITTDLNVGRLWNFEGARKDEWVIPGLTVTLTGQTQIGGNYMWSRETFREKYFPGIRRTQLWGSTAPWQSLSLNTFLSFGNLIARTVTEPELGKSRYIELGSTFRPWDNVTISPSFITDRLDAPTGENYYEITLLRARLSYQLNKQLSVRVVTEYNDFDHSLSFEPLITYRINPFSVFYLGSSHGYESYGQQRLFDKTESTRQIFAKIQYLFQV